MADDPPPSERAKATEHLWKTLQSINEWTRFADAKAGAILTANGVLGTLAAGYVDKHADLVKNLPLALVAGIGCLLLIVSTFYCGKCLLPKTSLKGGTRSLLFFDHIADVDESTYLRSAEALIDEHRALHEVGKQVWANARVAREKHGEIRLAIWLSGVGLACAVIVVLGVMYIGR